VLHAVILGSVGMLLSKSIFWGCSGDKN